MYNSMLEAELKRELPERKKVKKKMSKAQMQLAVIKKKQCDARALLIVEQLLEPNVNPEWLLCNLKHINKSHMEDVIEERAIIKLCGYVLCNKPLTVVITQQYHISMKKNKVYDVSKRKNFCSSRCYGACNYLLEQMLTSPLWLREKEDIPTFTFLSQKDEWERSTPGEEVHVGGTDTKIDTDHEKESTQFDINLQDTGNMCPSESTNTGTSQNIDLQLSQTNDTQNSEIIDSTETSDIQLESAVTDKQCEEDIININHDDEQDTMYQKVLTSEDNVELKNIHIQSIERTTNIICKQTAMESTNQKKEESTSDTVKTDNTEAVIPESDSVLIKEDSNTSADSNNGFRKQKTEKSKHSKHKKDKHKNDTNPEKQVNTFYTLAMHIERSVKEWITEDTICLLSGEESTKNRLLENVNQHDKYLQLCKKLNKLQLEDERDDRTDINKSTLKPLPHLSVLQEEGKKMELKVRAFYKGNMAIESPENKTVQSAEKNDDSPSILPLTDAHAPKALRRRIFLDKLNRILPDLLRALSGRSQASLQFTYDNERSALIKALVNTFSLSATNITFKTAEWTLVGLIIIKMLSIMDSRLKTLLATKQASMYISMILMSYKLDSNYLNRLVIELTNDSKVFLADDNVIF